MTDIRSPRVCLKTCCIGVAILMLMPACGHLPRDGVDASIRKTEPPATQPTPTTAAADGVDQFRPLQLGQTLDEVKHQVRDFNEVPQFATSTSNFAHRAAEVKLPNGVQCKIAFGTGRQVVLVRTSCRAFRINGHPVIGASFRQLRAWFPQLGAPQILPWYGTLYEVQPDLHCGFFEVYDDFRVSDESIVEWVEWRDRFNGESAKPTPRTTLPEP